MIITGFLNSQDMIRTRKQSRHDFSGKHVMDVVWILCDVYAALKIKILPVPVN